MASFNLKGIMRTLRARSAGPRSPARDWTIVAAVATAALAVTAGLSVRLFFLISNDAAFGKGAASPASTPALDREAIANANAAYEARAASSTRPLPEALLVDPSR